MKKIFVLDTNVLLYDPWAMFAFEDNEVVIPIYVIEEIDSFKKDLSELGRNARQVARLLDGLRQEGSLAQGVPTSQGGAVRVALAPCQLPPEFGSSSKIDNQILATAWQFHACGQQKPAQEPQSMAIFVTKDVNLRIRADALGLTVEDYDAERTDISELYSGVANFSISAQAMDGFLESGLLPLTDPYYHPNQLAYLTDTHQPPRTALGAINLARQAVEPLDVAPQGLWGVWPRNPEQSFAVHLLLKDDVKLVTLVGKAGTGKTLLAIAAGLQKVTEENIYQRVLISRPVVPLGRDIGYLPGDVEEKLAPWMQPIFDNIEFLMRRSRAERKKGRSYRDLMEIGLLEIESLTYIRGRSIPNQFMIVDEAQNLTPHEVKTIISRVGEHTKMILTGDPYQIDNPYVDATNNGLVHTVNRFRAEPLAGHVTLNKGERSELAELAANLL